MSKSCDDDRLYQSDMSIGNDMNHWTYYKKGAEQKLADLQ